jgi:serine/threonine protein kinase
MAETFVAVRRGPAGFEQRVCLKRILPGHTAEPTFVELFLDEARLLAQLRNAGIVQVYDFGEADGTYYMALELIDGADLEAIQTTLRRKGTRFPHEVAAHVVSQLLSALDYAHSLAADGQPLHIVHRDVTPSNILVSTSGETKLTDFGIAKARGRTHKTQTGHTKGKLAYMSPEQVRGEALDGRSDLFAVGVVLYELLSGEHPFQADTDLALLHNILDAKRKPLSELVPEAPPELIGLVDDLLAPDANQRPESAHAALVRLPFSKSPFALQRELAELVKFHREHSPRKQPASLTPPSSAAASGATAPTGQGPRDGATLALPTAQTTSQRLAFSGATGTRERAAPERRRVVWGAAAAAAVALLVGGVVWSLSSTQISAAPAPPALPKVAAPGPAPADIAPIPEPAQPSAAPPVGAEASAPTDAGAAPVVLQAPDTVESASEHETERTRRDGSRRTRGERRSGRGEEPKALGAAAGTAPAAGAATSRSGRGRTGALSADEF